MQPHLEATKLVFIDETGATTNMTRRRGRSPRGKRCRASVSHGHWKTTTLVCGLRLDGLTAPMVMDGAAFRAYARAFPYLMELSRDQFAKHSNFVVSDASQSAPKVL